MAYDGYPVFDSDLHVIEPADLWTRYIDSQVPQTGLPVGLKDEPFSTGNLVQHDGAQYSPRKEAALYFEGAVDHCLEQAHLRGRYEQYLEFDKRNWGPDTQIEAMDTEGVDAAVLFPTRGLAAAGHEYEEDGLAGAVARAYNDWMADFCSHAPESSLRRCHDTSAECRAGGQTRCGVLRASSASGEVTSGPIRSRVVTGTTRFTTPCGPPSRKSKCWSGFHEGYPCTLPFAVGERFDGRHEDWWLTEHVTRHPIEMMYTMTCMVNGGVLKRFPGLRVGFPRSQLQLGALLVVAYGRAL